MSSFPLELVMPNFGREKSASFRLWRKAAREREWHKIEGKRPRRAFKRAVRRLREMLARQ